ncbi:MAG: sporulation protein YunB [Ruminiclostridium sp.]|nr:sporulation protein YunB [Ruminiclostridium sp.]
MKLDLSKLKHRLGLKLIGTAVILLGFAGILQLMIRPNIINVCEYNSKAVTISLIDDAINERLVDLGENADYGNLVKLSYTSDGKVASIESNTKLINRIKNDMLTEINDRLMKGETENVDLTVGTLSGIPLFHGSGPTVRMEVEPKGYADAVFISEFTDAGLNQTLHRMIMRTTVSVTAFIPMYSVETKVSGDFLIAETVIVGNVPESFTHVVSDDKDVVDAINDFEAEPYE